MVYVSGQCFALHFAFVFFSEWNHQKWCKLVRPNVAGFPLIVRIVWRKWDECDSSDCVCVTLTCGNAFTGMFGRGTEMWCDLKMRHNSAVQQPVGVAMLKFSRNEGCCGIDQLFGYVWVWCMLHVVRVSCQSTKGKGQKLFVASLIAFLLALAFSVHSDWSRLKLLWIANGILNIVITCLSILLIILEAIMQFSIGKLIKSRSKALYSGHSVTFNVLLNEPFEQIPLVKQVSNRRSHFEFSLSTNWAQQSIKPETETQQSKTKHKNQL